MAEAWEPDDPAAERKLDDPVVRDEGWDAAELTEARKPLGPARAWMPDGLA